MSTNPERGSSSLAFVLLLFSLGMLMLNGLQQQLNQQRYAVASEVRFLKQYAGAISALAWGSQQNWQVSNYWQCQQWQEQRLRACLLITEKGDAVMAAQEISAPGSTAIALWHWGELVESRWRATPHGWLDFCPFTEAERCQLPE